MTLLEVQRGTLKDKKDDVEANRLVDRLEENLPQAGADRHWNILRAVMTGALAKRLNFTLLEGRGKTLDKTNCYTVEEAVASRRGDTSAMWRTRQWSIRLLSFYQRRTLKELATHTHTLTGTTENAETRRPSDKLANKKAKAPPAKPCTMITVAEVETRLQQLKNMEATALLGKIVNASRKRVGRDTWEHTGRCKDQQSCENTDF